MTGATPIDGNSHILQLWPFSSCNWLFLWSSCYKISICYISGKGPQLWVPGLSLCIAQHRCFVVADQRLPCRTAFSTDSKALFFDGTCGTDSDVLFFYQHVPCGVFILSCLGMHFIWKFELVLDLNECYKAILRKRVLGNDCCRLDFSLNCRTDCLYFHYTTLQNCWPLDCCSSAFCWTPTCDGKPCQELVKKGCKW